MHRLCTPANTHPTPRAVFLCRPAAPSTSQAHGSHPAPLAKAWAEQLRPRAAGCSPRRLTTAASPTRNSPSGSDRCSQPRAGLSRGDASGLLRELSPPVAPGEDTALPRQSHGPEEQRAPSPAQREETRRTCAGSTREGTAMAVGAGSARAAAMPDGARATPEGDSGRFAPRQPGRSAGETWDGTAR